MGFEKSEEAAVEVRRVREEAQCFGPINSKLRRARRAAPRVALELAQPQLQRVTSFRRFIQVDLNPIHAGEQGCRVTDEHLANGGPS